MSTDKWYVIDVVYTKGSHGYVLQAIHLNSKKKKKKVYISAKRNLDENIHAKLWHVWKSLQHVVLAGCSNSKKIKIIIKKVKKKCNFTNIQFKIQEYL